MTQRVVFQQLLAKYKKAWERQDPGMLGEIFTEDATYRDSPFDQRPTLPELWVNGPVRLSDYRQKLMQLDVAIER